MTLIVLSGFGTGAGLVGLILGLRRQKVTLVEILAGLERDGASHPTPNPLDPYPSQLKHPAWRVDHRIGRRLAVAMDDSGLASRLGRRWESSLRITGMTCEALCSQVVMGMMVAVSLPFVAWSVLALAGIRISIAIPVWLALVLGSIGAVLPLLALNGEVKRRRRVARKVVGTFLDLVVLCLAGGMGIEGALLSAAQVGRDDISNRLLTTLIQARDSGEPPWNALTRLGRELEVGELEELSASVSLAGTQGSKIRSTLAAKATSIRQHELADAESEANAITERLFLPGTLLLMGFLLFIAYPAVARIASGF